MPVIERTSGRARAYLARSWGLMLCACTPARELGATVPASWGEPAANVDSSSDCPAIAGTFEDAVEGVPGNAGASDFVGSPPRPVDETGLVGPMRLSYLLLTKIVDPPPEYSRLTLDQNVLAISVRAAGQTLVEQRFLRSAGPFSCAHVLMCSWATSAANSAQRQRRRGRSSLYRGSDVRGVERPVTPAPSATARQIAWVFYSVRRRVRVLVSREVRGERKSMISAGIKVGGCAVCCVKQRYCRRSNLTTRC